MNALESAVSYVCSFLICIMDLRCLAGTVGNCYDGHAGCHQAIVLNAWTFSKTIRGLASFLNLRHKSSATSDVTPFRATFFIQSTLRPPCDCKHRCLRCEHIDAFDRRGICFTNAGPHLNLSERFSVSLNLKQINATSTAGRIHVCVCVRKCMSTYVQMLSIVPLIRCMHVDGEGVKRASVLARTLFWVLIPLAITPPECALVFSFLQGAADSSDSASIFEAASREACESKYPPTQYILCWVAEKR